MAPRLFEQLGVFVDLSVVTTSMARSKSCKAGCSLGALCLTSDETGVLLPGGGFRVAASNG